MKITKQLLEKLKTLDDRDRALLAAYKALKNDPKAYGAIYAYTYSKQPTVYLKEPVVKRDAKGIDEFIQGFQKGKEATQTNVDVFYRTQLDNYEDDLRERGLIESHKFKLKEAAEKEFDVIFSDGPTSNRSERTIIKAKDIDDAMSKAYNMPQAKRYSNVIVGERIVGKTNYIVAFNYTILDSKGNEVKQPFKNESRMVIEADSETQAKSVYNKNCFGKYFVGYSFRNGTEIVDKPVPGKQCGKFGRVFDCYQGGAVPRFKADESLILEAEMEKEDDFYIKAGILGTDVIKENLKPITVTEALKHLKNKR